MPEQVEAAAADVPRFTVKLLGVGSFPSAERGRALWAGFEETELITDLAVEIEAGLVEEFPAEKRPFHPHLTMARSDPPVKLPAAYTATILETDPWEIDHVVLFRSHLGRPAPRYLPVVRVPTGRLIRPSLRTRSLIDPLVPTRTRGSSFVTDMAGSLDGPSARAAADPQGVP